MLTERKSDETKIRSIDDVKLFKAGDYLNKI
jgi:hypothetical protein